MAHVRVGDLVEWTAGDKVRVAVVKSVNQDGTCTVKRRVGSASSDEIIRTERLKTITSTIEAEKK